MTRKLTVVATWNRRIQRQSGDSRADFHLNRKEQRKRRAGWQRRRGRNARRTLGYDTEAHCRVGRRRQWQRRSLNDRLSLMARESFFAHCLFGAGLAATI